MKLKVESSGKAVSEIEVGIELPVVQLYICAGLAISCPYRPSRRVIPSSVPFEDRQSSPDGPCGPLSLSSVVAVFVDGCLAILSMFVFVIGDSLVDWRFYCLDMLPVNNTRGSKFGCGFRVSGWLLMILAIETGSARMRN